MHACRSCGYNFKTEEHLRIHEEYVFQYRNEQGNPLCYQWWPGKRLPQPRQPGLNTRELGV